MYFTTNQSFKDATHKILFKTKQKKIIRTINNLQNDPTIILKPADKNLGLVIMDTTTYIKAGEDKLTKTNNYKRVTTEIPYKDILKEVIDILIESKMLILKDNNIPINYTMQIDWTQFIENQYTPLIKLLLFYFDHPDMIRICRLYLLPKYTKVHSAGEKYVLAQDGLHS